MNPYLGEIIAIPFNFAPVGFALCNGQLLPINGEYAALYQLIGTTYGGDGEANFALPNLQGNIAIHQGSGLGLSPYVMGEIVGLPAVQLTGGQLGAHTHDVIVSNSAATSYSPAAANLMPADSAREVYAPIGSANTTLGEGAVATAGGSQAHPNLQPFVVINYAIALVGIYPTQS